MGTGRSRILPVVLALVIVGVSGCSDSAPVTQPGESVVQRAEVSESTGSEPDDELIEALAGVLSLDSYGPDVNRCAAQLTVTRIGGDELRAIGWTPEAVSAPGFSPYLSLDDEQIAVFSTAWVECVDPIQLSLELVPLPADAADPACLDHALGPDPTGTVLAGFPGNPGFDAGVGLGDALLVCVAPVDLVTPLWVSAGRWYTSGRSSNDVKAENADAACIESWLGADPKGRTLTLFELIQSYRLIDDPVPLVEQLDRLNDGLTTGTLQVETLDELDACFIR